MRQVAKTSKTKACIDIFSSTYLSSWWHWGGFACGPLCCNQMNKLEKQITLSDVIRCSQELLRLCGNMAQIQDANWLIAPVSFAGMLMGAACQFCSGSFNLQEPFPRRRSVQQLFVTSSLEQLLLYVLNLVVMATLLPHSQLKLVPILVAMFIFGRWG